MTTKNRDFLSHRFILEEVSCPVIGIKMLKLYSSVSKITAMPIN